MSYLEGLSKYTEDLTNQRDNFENMINQHKDRLGDQFQRKFDEITFERTDNEQGIISRIIRIR